MNTNVSAPGGLNAANQTKRQLRLYKYISFTILWVFLLALAIMTLFPVVVAILGSFKTNMEVTVGATLLPEKWHFSNYIEAWKKANFALFTWNSVFVSAAATVGTLLVTSMAAYSVDRGNFPGKKAYVALQASTMFISIGAVVLRPQFDLMVALHLNQSLWGVILILISAHATAFFMLIGFFKGIPKDLDEAAYIDGCNYYTVYWRIILPLLKPAIGVTALFTFRNAWNEYILPFVFTMSNPKLQTLTVGLTNLKYGVGAAAELQLMLAGACISIVPMLVVYIFANKSFMQVTAGSLKG
ncbi:MULTISPECIES: carbohydrate ABC transporter permease [unclassified Paenibacillus]|uniref:carbohydrate ABC transporter permease n=1 Tax=unclassified Paenibacillus TaxID=185978 RepID=UPI0009AEE7E3|nr:MULTISPECIES: carbohydrate ABC transporter permease [unclassified Paenibacillus]MBE1442455.1 ABC-type glycerol-3-phosphate transport system permease component [Paenibacillus sp. OAS669]